MTRSTVLRSARITGHVGWWVFVVATLFAGGITWWESNSRIAASFAHDGEWTAYTPLTSIDAQVVGIAWQPMYTHWWQDPSWYALAAFVVVVIAALVDAATARRLVPGVITVAVPFVALGLFYLATPGTIDGVELRTVLSMLLVLVGVGIREVWMRVGAPAIPPAGSVTAAKGSS
ncbi:hypothetical protein GTV32_20565 [Gordonia sp. SID5947]|uniref:hypothetical protein n=1 Tax=Gordonia sp. SID5947 TaxID=2690315 RepID=UPI00136D69E7|nr:hypothetical protein [Gordonia sp. SID5947]MYR08552.1 hypothetical protein [Gordonia sp. SID5947]